MSLSGVKYDAFISYRHREVDMAVAKAVQKKLENFKLPRSLKGKTPNGKEKITRIFRDQDELPLAANLSDPIEEALANSEFLIVICTPRLPESQWCAKEIETFIGMHGRDHVLAVLAEGEPDESFPERLRFEKYIETDENGEEHEVIKEFEPLAAEARGKNASERNKNINDAVIRLAAPMFGLNYDDLKQRHKEARTKKIITISSAIAAVFFVFALVCMGMALRISAQKKTIEAQYRKEQIKYAESMADASFELMEKGLRKDALYSVRNAMPASKSDDDIPYSAAAEYALTNASMLYHKNGVYQLFPEFNLDNSICAMNVSSDGRYLVVLLSDCTVHVFDAIAHEELDSFDSTSYSYDNRTLNFVDTNSFLIGGYDGTYRYYIDTKEKKKLSEEYCSYAASEVAGKYYICDADYFYIYEALGDNVLSTIAVSDYIDDDYGLEWMFDYTLDASGNYLTATFDTYKSGYKFVIVFDLKNDNVLTSIIVNGDGANGIIVENFFYILAYENSIALGDSYTNVYAYNLVNGNNVLSTTIDNCRLDKFTYANDGSGDMLLHGLRKYCRINIVDHDTYFVVGEFPEQVIDYYYNGSVVKFISNKGSLYSYSFAYDDVSDYTNTFFTDACTDVLDNAIIDDGLLFKVYSGENYIAPYYVTDNSHYEEFGACDSGDNERFSLDGKYAVLSEASSIILNDNTTGEALCTIDTEDAWAYMVEDGSKYFFVDDGMLATYSLTGEKILEMPKTDENSSYYGLACNNKYMAFYGFCDGGMEYRLKDIVSGKEVLSFTCDREVSRVEFAENDGINCIAIKDDGISLHKKGNKDAFATKSVKNSNVSQYKVSDDGKYLLVVYNNKTLEVLSTEDLSTVTMLFDSIYSINSVRYLESIDSYLVDCMSKVYLVNSDFEIVAEIPECIGFDNASKRFVIRHYGILYYCDYFTYEEKIKKTDDFLKDYKPSERIISKYHM